MIAAESQRVGRHEFILLMSTMFATIAFSVDAMLPALPQIAADLDLYEPGQAPLVLIVFMVGLGAGTLIAGPLSDAFGRKPIVYLGIVVYIIGAMIAWLTQSFDWMIMGRFVQGFGAAGPRIVSLAIIRDLYVGRDMARIMSLTLMIFLIFPAIAPAIGAAIIDYAGWRAIFAVFVLFGLFLLVWFGLRVQETLPQNRRRPLRFGKIIQAVAEMFRNTTARISIFVQTLMLGTLFGLLTMVQPIFAETFDRAESFPYWFGAIALLSGLSSLLNSRIVGRFGMSQLVTWALILQIFLSVSALILIWTPGSWDFPVYVVWQFGVLFQAGLTVANLNALAMKEMGHIAGIAASVIGAFATVGGAAIAAPLGLLFDGTPRPLIAATLVLAATALALMQALRRRGVLD
ncbi:MAG: Bcr/CflA family efflux MFS transporter [Pseudomonadota bacterium]